MSDFSYICGKVSVTMGSFVDEEPEIRIKKGKCYNCEKVHIVFKVKDCNIDSGFFVPLCIDCLSKIEKRIIKRIEKKVRKRKD